jgi:hypothetical protein
MLEENPITTESLLSALELKTLVVTPIISGSISFVASMTIIFMIYRSRIKLSTTYRRLVFGISVFDLIQSISQILSTFPMPAGYIWGASGNQTTCSIQGFLTVFGVSGTLLYSVSLSIYFISIIKFNRSDIDIKRNIEPYLHAISLAYCLIGGIYPWVTDNYNPAGTTCWVFPSKEICIDKGIDCQRPNTIALIFFTGGLCVAVFLINLSVLFAIWHTEFKLSRRNFNYSFGWLSFKFHRGKQTPCHANGVPMSPLEARLARPSRASQQRLKEISNRAAAYILCFFLTYGPSFGYRTLAYLKLKPPFFLMFICKLVFPLQGLFNILAYTYPHVVAFRREHEEYCWVRSLWEVVKGGGDSDEVRGGRHNGRVNKRNQRKRTNLRRTSMRKEPCVFNVEDVLDSDLQRLKTRYAESPQKTTKEINTILNADDNV